MIRPLAESNPDRTRLHTLWLNWLKRQTFFLRPPTLKASNFATLWLTDPKFLALKDLNLFKTVSKVQEASIILGVYFALSKWPHFNSVYLVRVPFLTGIAVWLDHNIKKVIEKTKNQNCSFEKVCQLLVTYLVLEKCFCHKWSNLPVWWKRLLHTWFHLWNKKNRKDYRIWIFLHFLLV